MRVRPSVRRPGRVLGELRAGLQPCPCRLPPRGSHSPFPGRAPEAPLSQRAGLPARRAVPDAGGARAAARPLLRRPRGAQSRARTAAERAPAAAAPPAGEARRGAAPDPPRPGPGAAAAARGRAGPGRRRRRSGGSPGAARGAALLAAARRRHERRAGRGGGGGRRRRVPGTAQGALGALLRDVLLPHRAGQQGAPQRLQVSAGAERARAPRPRVLVRRCRAVPGSPCQAEKRSRSCSPSLWRDPRETVPLGSRADSLWAMCWQPGRFVQF